MELKKYKLGEVADIQTGPFGSQLHNEDYVKIGIPIVTVEHLGERNFSTQNLPMVSTYDADRLKKYSLKSGDIVFSRVGAVDRCSLVEGAQDGWLFSGRCLRVRPYNGIDSSFLYYYLNTESFKSYIRNVAVGCTMPSLNTSILVDVPVWLPDYKEQHNMGIILEAIDRKIALNREINRNLEAMARQLYDYWFVQFDFPDENGRPYKSSSGKMVWNDRLKREIPQGWNVDNILSICEIKVGGTPSKFNNTYWDNGSIPFFGPTDVSDNIFQLDTVDHITHEGLAHCASSLFQVGDIILTARGSIGKMVIVGEPMAMNQSCYALSPKFQNTTYLYFLSKELIEWLKAKGSGSVFKSFNVQDVEYSQLCIAPTQIIERFCNYVNCLFSQIRENTKEIATLIAQREELLPLLMNGQVSVMPQEVNCDLAAIFVILG